MALQMARVQGQRAQEAAVPHVADPPPLRAARLAGDDGDHPLLADRRGVRRRRARPVHRRLHPHLGGATCRDPRPRPRHRRGGDRPRPAARAAPTSSPSDDAVDERTQALAAELGIELVAGPDAERLGALVGGERAGRPGAGRARDPPACSPSPPPPAGRSPASSSSPTGGSRSGRAARGRCSPSPAPTARRRPRCSPSTCSRPPGSARVAAGNTDVPLVEALDLDVDAFVVECTSFRLAWTARSAATPRRGSTWRPTTSTGTPGWPATRPPRRGSSPSSGPTTWRSASPTTRS